MWTASGRPSARTGLEASTKRRHETWRYGELCLPVDAEAPTPTGTVSLGLLYHTTIGDTHKCVLRPISPEALSGYIRSSNLAMFSPQDRKICEKLSLSF